MLSVISGHDLLNEQQYCNAVARDHVKSCSVNSQKVDQSLKYNH